MKISIALLAICVFGSVLSYPDLHGVYNNRVYGGVQANLGDFPFFAYLESVDASNYAITCAGSFIRYNFILTVSEILKENLKFTNKFKF